MVVHSWLKYRDIKTEWVLLKKNNKQNKKRKKLDRFGVKIKTERT